MIKAEIKPAGDSEEFADQVQQMFDRVASACNRVMRPSTWRAARAI